MSSAYKDWQIRGHGLTPARHVLCVTVRSVCRTAGHKEGLRAGLIVAPCQSGDPTHLKTQHGLIQQLSRSPIQGYVHHCLTRKSMQQELFGKETLLLRPLPLPSAQGPTQCELTGCSLFIMWASMRCPLSPSATVGSSVWGDSREPHCAQASITV